jgi:hypothetical protein
MRDYLGRYVAGRDGSSCGDANFGGNPLQMEMTFPDTYLDDPGTRDRALRHWRAWLDQHEMSFGISEPLYGDRAGVTSFEGLHPTARPSITRKPLTVVRSIWKGTARAGLCLLVTRRCLATARGWP